MNLRLKHELAAQCTPPGQLKEALPQGLVEAPVLSPGADPVGSAPQREVAAHCREQEECVRQQWPPEAHPLAAVLPAHNAEHARVLTPLRLLSDNFNDRQIDQVAQLGHEPQRGLGKRGERCKRRHLAAHHTQAVVYERLADWRRQYQQAELRESEHTEVDPVEATPFAVRGTLLSRHLTELIAELVNLLL
eukprot:CAMPEP_0181203456 /NCGR_PEP_ID=MMETSP1096-20121128/19394_1 /TAXON_ID=156174 ORGANISM="Chrysochromulina ericina, Strain CCMP281" /NCGR_SAMPLE_ID=MMETSP1096 /ASSEMBLY_ACC=CAM_ASM_000453 /LENGTH=190 /DNA_ID=CAMNT_0023294055 /DNA_START=480 /DNA_END=1053 /DNA_ORIENTATION=+